MPSDAATKALALLTAAINADVDAMGVECALYIAGSVEERAEACIVFARGAELLSGALSTLCDLVLEDLEDAADKELVEGVERFMSAFPPPE